MIMSEIYNGPNNATPLFRIYSDKGYYLQSGENRYIEAFISDEKNIKNYYETIFPIPSPIANTEFVYQTFLGDYRNITQRDVLTAKPIIKKAIYNLEDIDLYEIFNLLDKWQKGKEYDNMSVITYKRHIYKVLQTHTAAENPDKSKYYEKVERPLDFALEWDENNIPYAEDETVRVGDNFYQSLLNDNIWSPTNFPSAWKLITKGGN